VTHQRYRFEITIGQLAYDNLLKAQRLLSGPEVDLSEVVEFALEELAGTLSMRNRPHPPGDSA